MTFVTIGQERPPDADGVVSFELDARFDDVVEALLPDRDVPSPAWLEQARRNARLRSDFLDRVGALTAEQVADLAGSSARNRRQTAHRWASGGEIFAVEMHEQMLYPGFQFAPETQRPRPVVAEVIAALPPRLSGWELALWWTSDVYDPEAGSWAVPLATLGDRERLLRLAAVTHAEWRAAGAA